MSLSLDTSTVSATIANNNVRSETRKRKERKSSNAWVYVLFGYIKRWECVSFDRRLFPMVTDWRIYKQRR